MDDMKIIDYAPYVLGESHFPSSKERISVDVATITQFAERVKSDQVAQQLFDMCEKYTDFFSMHVDAKTWVPIEQRAEVFYALKNGSYNTTVPSFCVYMLKKAWEQCHSIPNLIVKSLPQAPLKEFLSSGYLQQQYSLRDVICSTLTSTYEPLSEHKKKIRHGDWSEIYVAATDMVAAIPNRIADDLTDSMIDVITVTPDGLSYGQSLLRTMGGYYGITNSVYDLRELV